MALCRSLPAMRSIASAPSLKNVGRMMAPAACSGQRASSPEGGSRGGRDWRVLLPVGQAAQGSGVRGFGVIDSVQNKIANRNRAKQETAFQEQMDELSRKDGFTFDDYAKIIEEPLNKLSAKAPWNKNNEELKSMKLQKAVLSGLTATQRKNPDTVRAGHRQAIADRAGCSMEDVFTTLAAFRELRAMQKWLATRRRRKEKLPRTQEEMTAMATDPSGTTLLSFMKVKNTGSGRPSFRF